MYSNLGLYFVSLLVLVSYTVCEDKFVVETTHGQISGKVLKTLFKKAEYYRYIGIPYAKPPIGELRFKPPEPIEPWEGIYQATKLKPECAQFNNNVKRGNPLGVYGSEDCLYLDIYTPGTDEENRAVIVFLLNHHFQSSYNKTKDYIPEFFIEEDVVVVTLSHRLAVLGFLSLENDELPGNSGLKDIVQGLEWVKDNIEYFGGNPKRITLMGLQGGAAGIDLLMYSKAKELFSAAILQSGTSWTSAYLQEDLRKRSFELGKMMDIKTTSDIKLIKELQEIPAEKMLGRDLHASPNDYFKDTQRSVIAFGPIVEKQQDGLITEYPEDSDTVIDIPLMMGFNSREGIESSIEYLIEPRYMGFFRKDFPVLLPRRLKFKFDPLSDVFTDIIEEIKNFYFHRGQITLKSVPDVVTMMGDVLIGYALDYTVKEYSKRSSKPVYYYHFDYYSDLNINKKILMKFANVEDGTWGSATGDEMCYLFKCPSLKDDYLWYEKINAEERMVQKKMVKLWTNFAKYGNPTPDNDDQVLKGLKWPAYTLENKEYLLIDKKFGVNEDLYKNRFEFWDNFIAKWEQKAVNGVITESINKKKDEL